MRLSLMALFLCLASVPAAAQRLPSTVTPLRYALWFAPDLERETFRGRESIDVTLAAPSTSITLHAAEIAFLEATIEDGGGSQPARVSLNATAETATLTVPRAIARGPATIRLTYTGILNNKLRGFYLSKANGRKYAVSQMEATDARRAFPSFDEPAYKATFDITLMIDAADTAISNGRQVSDSPGPEPGKHTIVFAPTPKMSTYLVALLVGDFVCRSGAAGATPIRICATPDKQGLTAFALSAAEQQVAFFNTYFGIPYPYEKLDIIGVPDFAAGAMENAGAITFREQVLLADEATASVEVRKLVASVIAHELAHQWFGNLVTMKWWDDIWLNEGFATWAANKPLAAWKPEWKMDVKAAVETQIALNLDALRTTRAIHTQVETAAQINEVFDPIAYEKTAGVLGMIEAYVGPEAFRKGVSSYLAKYALGNAAGEDFWTEVTRVTEKPVNRIMKSFVDQPGAPVLSVQTRCVGGNTEVSLKQERFVGAPGPAAAARRADVDAAGLRQDGVGIGDLHHGDRTRADHSRARVRRGNGQRRCARLLPHRVRAGGGGGARHSHTAVDACRTSQPAGRRVADGAVGPARRRNLPRSRRRVRARRDAVGGRRDGGTPRRSRRRLRQRGPARGMANLGARQIPPGARRDRIDQRSWRQRRHQQPPRHAAAAVERRCRRPEARSRAGARLHGSTRVALPDAGGAGAEGRGRRRRRGALRSIRRAHDRFVGGAGRVPTATSMRSRRSAIRR